MKLKVSDREWKDFRISEIFETIKNGEQVPTGAYIEKKYLNSGKTPRITVTSENNGINNFWDTTHKNKREFSNFISVNFLGDAFYHPYSATLDMKVHCLKLIDRELNQYLANFLCCALMANTKNSNYGNQLSSKDIVHKSVLLPVNDSGEPDYDFMEKYAKEKESKFKKKYKKYCTIMLNELGDIVPLKSLSEKKWKEFFIDNIFKIQSGKRLESYNMLDGTIPFIGATNSGNGITNYISNQNDSLDKNVLGVNYNGNGMVISFYHPYECLFSDDVKRFHLKNHDDNKFVFLFLKTIILQQKSKYNYGYKFNATRMERQLIMLPITDNGAPDYDYMEQYTKNCMIKKYNEYLELTK